MGDLSRRGQQNTWDAYEDILQTLRLLDDGVVHGPQLAAGKLHELGCQYATPGTNGQPVRTSNLQGHQRVIRLVH